MTRKTGKMAVKARQLARSAKLARYKRELAHAGVSLSLPKPSAKARKEKEEELKKLYLELFPKKAEEKGKQAEQPAEGEQSEQSAEKEEEKTDHEQTEAEDDMDYDQTNER